MAVDGHGARWRHAWWLLMVPLGINALTGPWLVAIGDVLDGVMLTGFCVLAGWVVWEHKRQAGAIVWVIPATFAAIAGAIAVGGDTGLMAYYAVLAAICVLGALLMGSKVTVQAASVENPA